MVRTTNRSRAGWLTPICAAAACFHISPPAIAATTANWQGINGASWGTAGNWDINQVPNNNAGTTYNVNVAAANGNTVSLNISPTINAYTQVSGSLVGTMTAQTMTVTGLTTWNSGSISQLSLNANGGLTVAQAGGGAPTPTLGSATLSLTGPSTISSSTINGLAGAQLTNTSNGILNLGNGTNFADTSGGVGTAPVIYNSGTTNTNGAVTVGWSMNTGGTLEAQTGSVNFTGGLDVYGGTLKVDKGATLTSSSNILVNNASVGGAGTINGNVELLDGTIQGAPTPGNLQIFGNLQPDTGDSASSFDTAVGGPASDPNYADQVVVNGNVELPPNLDVTVWPGYTPPADYNYVILEATGDVTGQFLNAAPGQRIVSEDGGWSFVANYGSGPYSQEVVLSDFQQVPEPTALILAPAGLLLMRRRQTHRQHH
jgi:hypothetical protein